MICMGIAALAFSSCSNDDDTPTTPEPTPTETADEVNNFVWNAMNSWYYWQSNVPNLADSFETSSKYISFINGKTPDKLFYSLLYNYGSTDRFSWIENDNSVVESSRKAEIESTSGLNYGLYPKDNSGSVYVALVNYVSPGSSAEAAGIKRGDVITKVNGSQITANNYGQLENTQFTITRALTTTLTSTALVTTDRVENITISKTDKDVNPVAFYKKFVYGSKNIGYLVFNAFKADYNDELNKAFAQMKTDGVNELILDLRYNGGGSLETAVALAQMINGSFTGSEYTYLDFNNKHNNEDGWDYLKNTVNTYNIVDNYPEKIGQEAVNSLTLPKIYVLVSFQTASASELTISSLGKYINITTIGDETVGKFVGSITLYDSPDSDYTSHSTKSTKHKWQLQPITFAYYNKDEDPIPTGGIEPSVYVNPYENFNNIKEFGETSDPALKEALELITGQTIGRVKATQIDNNINYRSKVLQLNATNTAKGLNIHNFDLYKSYLQP